MNMDSSLLSDIDKIMEQYVVIHDEIEKVWITQIVFKWHWWVDVALAVVPWIVWLIARDKKRTHSLLYAGLFSMFMASILDMVGVSQRGWNYDTMMLPYLAEYLPWDLTVMPVGTMVFIQKFPKINPWLKGVAFGISAAYIIEPIFVAVGLYEAGNWEHYYSLPIYFAIFMASYWLYAGSLCPQQERACKRRRA